MQYEKEILINLLNSTGLCNSLDDSIKPSKHPNMAYIEAIFNHVGIKYLYFPETDSLAITQIDMAEDNGDYNSLCHTLIMPNKNGISVLIVVPNYQNKDDVLQRMSNCLDSILPPEIAYNIVGIM